MLEEVGQDGQLAFNGSSKDSCDVALHRLTRLGEDWQLINCLDDWSEHSRHLGVLVHENIPVRDTVVA